MRSELVHDPPRLRLHVPRSAVPNAKAGEVVEGRKALSVPLGSLDECHIWKVVVQTAARACWQTMLEAAVLPPPEIYQMHARAKLLPKKGGAQSRLLALSDQRVHCVCRDGLALRGSASSDDWAVGVAELCSVELLELKDKRAPLYPHGLALRYGQQGSAAAAGPLPAARRSPSGELEAVFVLKTQNDVRALVAALRQLFRHETGADLPILRPKDTADR